MAGGSEGSIELPDGKFGEFRDYLKRVGFEFEERPHQVFLARAQDLVVSLYSNGKVVIAGKDATLETEVRWYLSKLGARGDSLPEKLQRAAGKPRIGTDESGKGDYFGPLVAAGSLISPQKEERLRKLGVKDSKKLSESTVADLAPKIKSILGEGNFEIVRIDPRKYNILYEKIGNINRILAWAHSKVIENLLTAHPECTLVVIDEFSASSIREALKTRGKTAEVIQSTGGERDIAVAAASILARNEFIKKLGMMGREWGMSFPRGSSAVEDAAREFISRHGKEELGKVAKLHFATTERITGEKAQE